MKKLLIVCLVTFSFIAGAVSIHVFKPRFVLVSRSAIGIDRDDLFYKLSNVQVWEIKDRQTGTVFQQLVFASQYGQVGIVDDLPVDEINEEE